MAEVHAKEIQVNVFKKVTQLTMRLRNTNTTVDFDVGTIAAEARAFAFDIQGAAIIAAQENRITQNSNITAPTIATTKPPPIKLTVRVRAGRELREELQKITRLHGKGKWKEAKAAMEALDHADTTRTHKRGV